MTDLGNRASFLVGIALFGILGFWGYKNYQVLTEKAAAQRIATDKLEKYKQSYLALSAATEGFDKTFSAESSVQDMMGVYAGLKLTNAGLVSNVDQLRVSRIEPVKLHDVDAAVTRLCLSTMGMDTFEVTAHTYSDLLGGLKHLASRRDLSFEQVTIQTGKQGEAKAQLKSFCLLLRR